MTLGLLVAQVSPGTTSAFNVNLGSQTQDRAKDAFTEVGCQSRAIKSIAVQTVAGTLFHFLHPSAFYQGQLYGLIGVVRAREPAA